MSCDLWIIPTRAEFIQAGLLLRTLQVDIQFQQNAKPTGALRIQNLIDGSTIGKERLFRPKEFWRVDTGYINSLSLFCFKSEGDTDDSGMLKSFGENLTPEFRVQLIKQWCDAGYTISLESRAGRATTEFSMMIPLAACLAELCDGYVMVSELGFFLLDYGTYSPMAFRKTQRVPPVGLM